MGKTKKYFSELASQDFERTKQIEKDLVAFVKAHNNFIDMRNIKEEKENCYGLIFNFETEQYQECRILALTTFGDEQLGILIADVGDIDNYCYDMTKEQMLESKAWYSIFGVNLWIDTTLISICEVIEQYE